MKMKKISALLCGLAAVFALAGCSSKGTEVSAEEFETKAKAIEAHTYTGCTIKYDIDYVEKETGEEDTTVDESGKIELTWSEDEFEGETSSKAAQQAAMYVNTGLENFVKEFNQQQARYKNEGHNVKSELIYYVDPLGVELKVDCDFEGEEEGAKMKVNAEIEAYAEFNEYGYLVKLEEDMDVESSSTYKGVQYSVVMKGSIEISIEYK